MENDTSLPGTLDDSERAGLAIIGVAGLCSAICSFSLLSYLLFINGHYPSSWRIQRSPLATGIREFCANAMGRYLMSLMVSDFIQGTAFAANVRWAQRRGVVQDSVCKFQGILSQVGDMGIPLWSLVIAVHTFCLLYMKRKPAPWIAIVVLPVVWAFDIAMPLIGTIGLEGRLKRGSFWGPSGAWCWVADNYRFYRIAFFYAWVFLTLSFSVIIYTLIYLKFTGIFHGTPIRSVPSSVSEQTIITHRMVKIARRLMWYPIMYMVIVVPVTICRLGSLAGWDAPFGLYVFAGVCFASSGTINSFLFLFTRHSFILDRVRPRIQISTHQVTVVDDGEGNTRTKHSQEYTDLDMSSLSTSTTACRYELNFDGHSGHQSK
ncbi:hypothetical protein PUNSTDRAFT_143499 [Punctularia strigosozonata HHB-11173 SS5]|uniref:uncharacterized protein n=1 Tax=Punctularia strigosozonata (strain HHB-11173) TaxID=741275 RepID=UPI0004416787|nr:uncharacterized protein PUNSTDRAFT_143499 [Punctularia strigosozonata HHB-11173 SS5]EIN08781.1 hypothetical protein PUNSTDRAFT_143499 [Punctularia strigosozonata HHB-11173 SS5]